MSENSKIEWCDHTFNPWEGCQKVGPGCDNCYAEVRNRRFNGGHPINWGPGATRRRTSDANWRKPMQWQAKAGEFMAKHGRRQRVFCASLADVFDNAVPVQWRISLMRLIIETPDLDWLLLTKRIGNAAAMLDTAFRGAVAQRERWSDVVLPNVWIGSTITSQAEADRDIPKLLDIPASVRFLSMEPLLGPVDLTNINPTIFAARANALTGIWKWQDGPRKKESSPIDWVIVGGESGPGARPLHPGWIRSLRDQCDASRVPFLFKQWGEWKPINQMDEIEHRAIYQSKVIAKAHESQSDLDDIYGRRCSVATKVVHRDGSVHDITEPMAFLQGTDAMQSFKVGKQSAGRLLDGVEHNGFPAASCRTST